MSAYHNPNPSKSYSPLINIYYNHISRSSTNSGRNLITGWSQGTSEVIRPFNWATVVSAVTCSWPRGIRRDRHSTEPSWDGAMRCDAMRCGCALALMWPPLGSRHLDPTWIFNGLQHGWYGYPWISIHDQWTINESNIFKYQILHLSFIHTSKWV